MRDTDPSNNLSSAEEAEKFQTCFAELREDLESRITASDSLPADALKAHFTALNESLLTLQRLYSASSPYLRIYYRKIYQDALQALQTNIQETEARLLPRKKFVFKGNRAKKVAAQAKNGDVQGIKKDRKVLDLVDGADSCVYRDRADDVIVLTSTDVTGKALLLSRLRNCTVEIQGAPSTVHIADVTGTTIRCGPVATSVFVEAARCCHLQLACQQLRVHETTNSDFLIHVTSKAIIEECSNVKFGLYSFSYPALDADYLVAGLSRDVNNWRDVDDFNWLVAGQPSPNWSLLE